MLKYLRRCLSKGENLMFKIKNLFTIKKTVNNTEKLTTKNSLSYSPFFLYLAITFVVCLLLSNILAAKLLKIGRFSVTAGVLVFPISYIINDILSEVYGYEKAKKIILCGFVLNVFMVLIFQLAFIIPSPEWFTNDEAFKLILGSTPRTVLAGLVAYLLGSLVNAKVLTKMKAKENNKFGIRAIVSTLFGEATDSLIFVPIAFLGSVPFMEILGMIFIQVVIKTSYEIVCLPVTSILVKKVKKYEAGLKDVQ